MPSLLDLFNSVRGVTYPTAGRDPPGGTGGRSDFGPRPSSFDCSGFVAWAFYRATNGAVKLPAFTDAVAASSQVERVSSPRKGDIVLYDARDPNQPGVRYEHMAIYDGKGQVIQSGGIAHFVNQAPVNELPNPTFWRVKGVDASSLFDQAGTVTPSSPVTAPLQPPPGTPNPNPNPQTPIGGSGGSGGSQSDPGGHPVAAGEHWDLWTNGKEGLDWIRFKIPSPVGGSDWIDVRVPTPVGIAHAIGWGLHDAVAGWLPKAPGVSNETLGIPIGFYMLGGLAIVVGAIAIGFQAIDAATTSGPAKTVARVAALAA